MEKNEYVYTENRKVIYGLLHPLRIENIYQTNISHRMANNSVVVHKAYGDRNGDR